LNSVKINTILRYLERSKRLEIDLDGNIIWIRQEKDEANELSLAEVANICYYSRTGVMRATNCIVER
jgi:AraC-like DNA-binding protein